MEGVGVGSVADEFGESVCATAYGVLALFEHENSGTFAEDESIASGVPWAGCRSGIVVAGGEGSHGGEAGDGKGRDGGFTATANHNVGIAAL